MRCTRSRRSRGSPMESVLRRPGDRHPLAASRGVPMSDLDAFIDKLSNTPPSCIKNFSVATSTFPEPWDDNPTSVWQLRCKCGHDNGNLLGYSLADYNTDYGGDLLLVSPLAFRCNQCNATTELLDTDIHGYHADIDIREGLSGGAVKIRGTGDRQPFPCPKCNNDVFSIVVGFVFWNADELADEFDDRWEDLFNVFLCHTTCRECGHVSTPTDFGKL